MTPRIEPPALPGMELLFAAIREEAERCKTRALVVGGYVRDRLLGGAVSYTHLTLPTICSV